MYMLNPNKYRYLYERENYETAHSYVETSIKAFSDHTSLAYASAVDLRGLIELDICHPHNSLKSFEQAFNLRKAALPEDDPFLAANFVNYGLAFTEMGELDKARDYLQKSIDIRLKAKSDRIGNSYSNMASLLLRMGKPDEAEDMLKSCPSLVNFTDEIFLDTGNPRFSGYVFCTPSLVLQIVIQNRDMVLLSRIRLKQGLYDDALRFASKALTFRRECLPERLKVCDSLYQVANILQKGDNQGLAT